MEEYSAMFEDCESHEVYIEFQFEEWPVLSALDENARQQLCEGVSAALKAVACPVQAIKARPAELVLVVKLDENLSIDDVANIVEGAALRSLAASGAEGQGPGFYSAEGVSSWNVIDAVLRLQ